MIPVLEKYAALLERQGKYMEVHTKKRVTRQ
jgi:hypothetical protein